MTDESEGRAEWLSKLLYPNGLAFRDFVEAALYDPDFGYYAGAASGSDYATSVHISPVFAFAMARLADAFSARAGDVVSPLVDIGCGDGSLLAGVRDALPQAVRGRFRFFGVDRSLGRLRPELASDAELHFVRDVAEIPGGAPSLVLSNELFDAFPFARLVQRESALRELRVVMRDGTLEWDESDAPPEYVAYFADRAIRLETGQFGDVSLDWGAAYERIARHLARGVMVTIDYGFPQEGLFDARVRRWGTAAAFRRHRLSRDLLADPGEQDLTAHVNFTDLERAGERAGWRTVAFERQARFLLSLGVTDHPLLAPLDAVHAETAEDAADLAVRREAARRLVLPDGIGDEMRVLVQERGTGFTLGALE